MILLKSIQLKDFLSHDSTTVALSEDTKILLDGNSGSGKSSIVEGLVWALYGEARCDNRNLVRHGKKIGGVKVKLYDTESKVTYLVARTTTKTAKNTLEVSESTDGEHFIASKTTGMKDTQAWLENHLLHSSYELFINSVCYPQDGSSSFVKQNATKRKDLLLEMASVGDYEEYYNKARTLMAQKGEELLTIKSSIYEKTKIAESQKVFIVDTKKYEDNISSNENKKKSISLMIDGLKKEVEKNNTINTELLAAQAVLPMMEARVNVSLSRVARVNKAIEDINKVDTDAILAKMEETPNKSEEIKDLKALISKEYERQGLVNSIMADRPMERDYETEIQLLTSKLEPLLKEKEGCPAGDKCPFLGPIRNQIAFFTEQIEEKKKLRDILSIKQKEYTKKLAETGPSLLKGGERELLAKLEKDATVFYNLENQLVAALNLKKTLPIAMEDLKDAEANVSRNKQELENALNNIKTLESKINSSTTLNNNLAIKGFEEDLRNLEIEQKNLNSIITKSAMAEKMVSELEDGIKDLTKREVNVKIEHEQLALIKEAFGSKGLKTVVIDYLIPRLEERINNVLSNLSDFSIRLDTQRLSADGENSIEGLFINITNPSGQETSFESLSGGEKVKVTIAISEALASLQKCNFRILDEAIVSLDKESTESLTEVLGKIQSKFKQMLCISHLPEVKETFESKIEIIKVNGVSKIK